MKRQEPDTTEEYFDIVNVDGVPTGEIKRRSDAHRDGDWHRAFHCWVALRNLDGEPAILFQRRSMTKDTYPGYLDVAVGGHFRAGEGFDDVVREIEEELGIAPPPASLVEIGRRWAEGITEQWIDREIEDVYVYWLKEPIESLRPSYEEVTAVDVIAFSSIVSLFCGQRQQIPSRRFHVQPDNAPQPEIGGQVTEDDFIPATDDYWPAGSRAAVSVLNGERGAMLDLCPANPEGKENT